MSYRVDIPTLSANEVYTLTFEYEGTETIQLIVGDLTLETTDRRVVFTTTSPINYIESNVNLTNLNLYEGYYESDDFGGEYTQESYIEGMSLVNLIQSQKHLDFQNRDCGVETFEDNMIKLTITDVSSLTSTWQHGWIKTSANLKVGATYTCVIHVVENSISTEGIRIGASHGTLVHGSASNSLSGGETGVVVFTYTTATATLKDYNGYYDGFCQVNHVGDWQNGSLKYGIMVFEGDYYDYFINNNVPYFEGIGCVKSPKILSETKHRNIMLNTKPFATTNLITVSDDNTYIYLAEAARYSGLNFKFTQEYLAQHGISNGDKLCIELDGRLIEGTGTQAAKTSTRIGIDACSWSDGTSGLDTVYKNLPENGHYCDYITINGNVGTIGISFLNNLDWTGTNKIYEIQNFRVYKIEDISEMGTYDCCEVSTPDDLELHCNHHYDRNTKISNPCYQDTLDLTTGTVTRKNIKVRLNDTIAKYGSVEGALVTVNGGDMVRVKYNHINSSSGAFPVQVEGEVTGTSATGIVFSTSQGNYEGIWYPTGDIEHTHTSTNTIYMYFNPSRFDGIDYTDSTTIKNWLIEQDFTLIMKIQNASVYTEQLPTSLNALKSYHNGSITTSSQQLAPTLKTTLPVSNKFTTTNLTSGSTYNVYFDGTATKLDAGGTIITNPISPCEVECGGTTLTIEGTDIQNVKVIETTVKNEVGSVCGTTDVELSRIITECKYHNYFSDYSRYTGVDGGGATTTRENNKVILTTTLSWGRNGYQIHTPLSLGTYKFYCKVKVQNVGDKCRVTLHKNIDGASDVNYGFYKEITSTSLEEVIEYVGYFQDARYITFHGFAVNQVVEYYDISLIKLSDEDITGTDTSSINYSQSISTLEQPIKLRSLGTTYDSYNPITGELVKRIGVSETDGSYSVLSSPIAMETRKTEVNGYMADRNTVCKEYSKGYEFNTSGQLVAIDIGHYTDYYIKIPENTKTLSFKGMSYYKRIMIYDENKNFIKCYYTYNNYGDATGNITSDMKYVRLTTVNQGSEGSGYGDMRSYLVTDTNYLVFTSDTSLQTLTIPHLYTNGQVKVYSESEVYPTTILNGQSTNNYEINELNKSNNYTIRYEGECESINLANKSNEQGTNRIIKSGATSGNLTFVNNSEDIDNVLLVQNDVREQEINHFNGLETVEVSQLLVSSKQNLFEAYMKNDFDYEYVTPWNTSYSSLHRGVFNCGVSVAGNNSQLTFDLIHPKIGGGISEETPIMKAGQIYNISCDITVNDDTSKRKYEITFYAKSGSQIYAQKVDNILPVLSLNTTADNTNTTAKINANTFFNEDVYGVRLHAIYGGQWAFDCTITDFTICEPEYAKPDVPLVYEYIDLPQPVQLNSLPDGTCDTYNPITGEYVQNVGYFVLDDTFASCWRIVKTKDGKPVAQRDLSTQAPHYNTLVKDYSFPNALYDYQTGTKAIANIPLVYSIDHTSLNVVTPSLYGDTYFENHFIRIALPFTPNDLDQWNYSYTQVNDWLRENPIHIVYKRTEPITTQLTPINIPTFEGGILQLITTDGKVFPMIEYSMPTNNRYDTSSWEAGKVYTQRNMTEVYFNESTTPMTPTETMTLTTDHISSGSIILNDNGNGLIVLKGNYTGRDIPYFTGMRSVEAIEVETTPSPDQPLFGKGGRK